MSQPLAAAAPGREIRRRVVLRLHGGPISLNEPSDERNTHIPADVTGEDEMRIRERAYLLWEAEGKPEGRLDEYWDRACELIDDESLVVVPAGSVQRPSYLIRKMAQSDGLADAAEMNDAGDCFKASLGDGSQRPAMPP